VYASWLRRILFFIRFPHFCTTIEIVFFFARPATLLSFPFLLVGCFLVFWFSIRVRCFSLPSSLFLQDVSCAVKIPIITLTPALLSPFFYPPFFFFKFFVPLYSSYGLLLLTRYLHVLSCLPWTDGRTYSFLPFFPPCFFRPSRGHPRVPSFPIILFHPFGFFACAGPFPFEPNTIVQRPLPSDKDFFFLGASTTRRLFPSPVFGRTSPWVGPFFLVDAVFVPSFLTIFFFPSHFFFAFGFC